VDNDGDPDVVITKSWGVPPAPAQLLRNLGGGTFASTSLPAYNAQSALAGDLDHDGDVDLILGVFVLRNDGTGAFAVAGDVPVSPGPTLAFSRLVDADGDGDLDLVQWDTQGRLYRNNGSGVFSPAEIIVSPAVVARAVRAADLDGDGDMDLVTAGNGILTNTT